MQAIENRGISFYDSAFTQTMMRGLEVGGLVTQGGSRCASFALGYFLLLRPIGWLLILCGHDKRTIIR